MTEPNKGCEAVLTAVQSKWLLDLRLRYRHWLAWASFKPCGSQPWRGFCCRTLTANNQTLPVMPSAGAQAPAAYSSRPNRAPTRAPAASWPGCFCAAPAAPQHACAGPANGRQPASPDDEPVLSRALEGSAGCHARTHVRSARPLQHMRKAQLCASQGLLPSTAPAPPMAAGVCTA